MTHEQAICLLKVRDALVKEDIDEAWHWLYKAADYNMNRLDVWEDWERMAEEYKIMKK